mmetsp:Transcript_1439/g.3910  ORF Transcript_1439/g.3910 Transcript_1439/m.3910 type:complete len:282 (+) Transcript_1439:744-1589(+)
MAMATAAAWPRPQQLHRYDHSRTAAARMSRIRRSHVRYHRHVVRRRTALAPPPWFAPPPALPQVSPTASCASAFEALWLSPDGRLLAGHAALRRRAAATRRAALRMLSVEPLADAAFARGSDSSASCVVKEPSPCATVDRTSAASMLHFCCALPSYALAVGASPLPPPLWRRRRARWMRRHMASLRFAASSGAHWFECDPDSCSWMKKSSNAGTSIRHASSKYSAARCSRTLSSPPPPPAPLRGATSRRPGVWTQPRRAGLQHNAMGRPAAHPPHLLRVLR